MRGISPRLQVETDSFVFTFGNRPVAAQNIIATLPGRANPPQVIIISAHYDSRTVDISDTRSAAPGANDDGSGVAAVLELARALSAQTLDATFKFILFAGEEEGLFGSEHLAPLMRKDGVRIIAMLNNDIIGDVTGSDGRRVDNRVRIFSGDPDNGPSRQLARDAKRIVERAMPAFGVELVAALDRAGRGGDHIAFHYAGFPAIRFIEAVENLEHQHSASDRVEFMDMDYLANVVRANLAVALELGKTIRG
jgi:Zn-dependent M28 family amino/carboxypeptidase